MYKIHVFDINPLYNYNNNQGVVFIDNIDVIEAQIRQIFAGTVWTHKIQEKQSDIYLDRYKKLEFFRILLSAVSTSGIFTVIFVDEFILKICTAILSAISLFINSYFKAYDFKLLARQHKKSALDLLELREEIISVLCDIKLNKYTEDSLIIKRDEILKKQIDIYKRCLDARNKAVDKASDNLKNRKDNTYTDEEIDSFLPVLARKVNITH